MLGLHPASQSSHLAWTTFPISSSTSSPHPSLPSSPASKLSAPRAPRTPSHASVPVCLSACCSLCPSPLWVSCICPPPSSHSADPSLPQSLVNLSDHSLSLGPTLSLPSMFGWFLPIPPPSFHDCLLQLFAYSSLPPKGVIGSWRLGTLPCSSLYYTLSPLHMNVSSCKLSKMWTYVPSVSGVNETAACPPSPITDDPSALPSPSCSQ